MSLNFQDIQRLFDENVSGGKFIRIINADNVFVPAPLNHNIIQEISELNGDSFKQIDFTLYTLTFNEEEVIVDGFKSYRAEIVGIIPKDRLGLFQNINTLTRKRVVVIYHDLNEFDKVIGTHDEPATFDLRLRKNGILPSSRNDYEMVISCTRREPSPFYNPVPCNFEFQNGQQYLFQDGTEYCLNA